MTTAELFYHLAQGSLALAVGALGLGLARELRARDWRDGPNPLWDLAAALLAVVALALAAGIYALIAVTP